MEPLGGPPEPMLEGYTTLGYLAGRTERLRLSLLVTGVTYRHPGLLAKTVTTLDVLSGGRAMLGIGAAWYEREHRGLGVPFPSTSERFERLEETLQIVRQLWSGDQTPYAGSHYELAEPVNVPPPVQSPPPIMIGGSGERKTLRLVARYADACNLFGESPDVVRHKLDVLRGHCEDAGTDYDAIEKTAPFGFDVGERGEKVPQLLEQLRWLGSMGIETVLGWVVGVDRITPLEIMGREVIPALAEVGVAR
jgi:F420-dependent oxidoreductase-like protein